jgi:hypothetical protein
MDQLAAGKLDAYWYNPRNGKWHIDGREYDEAKAFMTEIKGGQGSSDMTFDAPGDVGEGNDWVLILNAGLNTG